MGIKRSTLYYQPKGKKETDIKNKIKNLPVLIKSSVLISPISGYLTVLSTYQPS
jgi:hypothetical protein